MSNNMENHLSASMLTKLGALFLAKGWSVDYDNDFSTFNRYAATLSRLDEKQQDFLIDVSNRFVCIYQKEYMDRLLVPLSQIRNKYLNNQLIFACCISKEDDGKIKSSASVLNQIRGTEIKTKINLGNYFVISKQSDLRKCGIKDDTKIVLVDDFVGTGESADEAINYVAELLPALDLKKSIIILCIAAMKTGVNHLKSEGYDVFYEKLYSRGISDNYNSDDVVNAISLMNSIEDKIVGLKPEFRFGYGRCEGLISMERCPNNTFPIYWCQKGIAPYER